jgi:predicted O-methyltransferase YrrM
MFQAVQFILHFLTAGTRHGLHSPFIYALVEQCIYSNAPQIPLQHSVLFNALKQQNRIIKGKDLGQGRITERSVAHYAKMSAMPPFQAALLHRLIHYLQPASVLELGTNLGSSLAAMALANVDTKCTGVEGNRALAELSTKHLEQLNIHNASVVCAAFNDYLHTSNETFDLIFLDGDHRYEPTLRYFEMLKRKLSNRGVLVLHDIYHSKAMKAAWVKIKQDPEVQVTVDLFFFGMVWLDLPQAKQDFKIRFPKSLLNLL